jgi:hypothetical protein
MHTLLDDQDISELWVRDKLARRSAWNSNQALLAMLTDLLGPDVIGRSTIPASYAPATTMLLMIMTMVMMMMMMMICFLRHAPTFPCHTGDHSATDHFGGPTITRTVRYRNA